MASPKTEHGRRQDWHDALSSWSKNRANPREKRPRDRSLRGKARRQARKAANHLNPLESTDA